MSSAKSFGNSSSMNSARSLSLTSLVEQPWHHAACSALLQDSISFAPAGKKRSTGRLALVVAAVLAVAVLTVGKYYDSSDLKSPTVVTREYMADTPVTLEDLTVRNGLCPCSVQLVPLHTFAQLAEGDWFQEALNNLTSMSSGSAQGVDAIGVFVNTVGSQFMSMLLRYFQQQLDGDSRGGQIIYSSNLQTQEQISDAFAAFTRNGILVHVTSWYAAFAAIELVLNADTINLIASLGGPSGNNTEDEGAAQSLAALAAAAPIFGSASSFGYEMIYATSTDILSLGNTSASSHASGGSSLPDPSSESAGVDGVGDPFEVFYEHFYNSIVIDWNSYKGMCNPQYCDYVTQKSTWTWTADFLATVGGSWTVVFLVAVCFWAVAGSLFSARHTSFVCQEGDWVPM